MTRRIKLKKQTENPVEVIVQARLEKCLATHPMRAENEQLKKQLKDLEFSVRELTMLNQRLRSALSVPSKKNKKSFL